MRALVIDDSRVMRKILSEILANAGYDVIDAENGREALALLKGIEPPHIALVDWNMPDMSGIQFVEAIRKDPIYDDMPLLMVTIETEMNFVKRALEAGANEYVMKPFTREMIHEKLEMLGITSLQRATP